MAVRSARKEKAVGDLHQVEAAERDPLQAFFAETDVSPAAEIAEIPQDPPIGPANATDEGLPYRLERVERQLERAQIELSTLKTDFATLVSAVEDIRKRPSRRLPAPAPVVPFPPRRVVRPRMIAAVVVVLALGAAAWSLASATSDELPAPQVLDSGRPGMLELPRVVEADPPYQQVVAPTIQPVVAPPDDRVPAAPRSAVYFGTLTIDAEPAGVVFLDRENVGRTPVRLEKLRAGSHLIWIEREGYRRWTRVVPVAADRISRVSASLDPIAR